MKWYGRGHETHGSHRPHVRTFNGFGISAQTRPARFLAFCLYLREHERNCDGLRKKRRREVVRMHPPREVPIRLEPNSARRRSSRASDAATFDLARDVKTMFPDQQRAIHCAIRPTGDYRLHRMGRLPDVQSVGAGQWLRRKFVHRQAGQRSGLLTLELPMGGSKNASAQPKNIAAYYGGRANADHCSMVRGKRHFSGRSSIQTQPWLDAGTSGHHSPKEPADKAEAARAELAR